MKVSATETSTMVDIAALVKGRVAAVSLVALVATKTVSTEMATPVAENDFGTSTSRF